MSRGSPAQDFIDGARNNGFGRPVVVQLDGDLATTYKQAGAMDALNRLGLHGALELGGLGLIAAPGVHSLLTGGKHDDNPTVHKIHQASDLAGLGLLASPYIMKLLGKGH